MFSPFLYTVFHFWVDSDSVSSVFFLFLFFLFFFFYIFNHFSFFLFITLILLFTQSPTDSLLPPTSLIMNLLSPFLLLFVLFFLLSLLQFSSPLSPALPCFSISQYPKLLYFIFTFCFLSLSNFYNILFHFTFLSFIFLLLF